MARVINVSDAWNRPMTRNPEFVITKELARRFRRFLFSNFSRGIISGSPHRSASMSATNYSRICPGRSAATKAEPQPPPNQPASSGLVK